LRMGRGWSCGTKILSESHKGRRGKVVPQEEDGLKRRLLAENACLYFFNTEQGERILTWGGGPPEPNVSTRRKGGNAESITRSEGKDYAAEKCAENDRDASCLATASASRREKTVKGHRKGGRNVGKERAIYNSCGFFRERGFLRENGGRPGAERPRP